MKNLVDILKAHPATSIWGDFEKKENFILEGKKLVALYEMVRHYELWPPWQTGVDLEEDLKEAKEFDWSRTYSDFDSFWNLKTAKNSLNVLYTILSMRVNSLIAFSMNGQDKQEDTWLKATPTMELLERVKNKFLESPDTFFEPIGLQKQFDSSFSSKEEFLNSDKTLAEIIGILIQKKEAPAFETKVSSILNEEQVKEITFKEGQSIVFAVEDNEDFIDSIQQNIPGALQGEHLVVIGAKDASLNVAIFSAIIEELKSENKLDLIELVVTDFQHTASEVIEKLEENRKDVTVFIYSNGAARVIRNTVGDYRVFFKVLQNPESSTLELKEAIRKVLVKKRVVVNTIYPQLKSA